MEAMLEGMGWTAVPGDNGYQYYQSPTGLLTVGPDRDGTWWFWPTDNQESSHSFENRAELEQLITKHHDGKLKHAPSQH